MKISLVTVGKTDGAELRDAINEYEKRLSRYIPFEIIETTDEKLAKVLDRYDRVFLLDDKGKEYSSMEFSSFIDKQMTTGLQSVAFVVGGPFGFTDDVRAMADGLISLSRMTFTHQFVRAVFLEQLYRAFTILRNERYHHE
ncbi:MAG: 23S rRNA (pseudouridine(1915)-N(3))-methyltransferase RlmH [bacterium]|nr:23S rRNA (pseudouridine(1915)-N(3))-methyltransferase RlmH [bacterium]